VKAGWIAMARSGQTHGLNGTVLLVTAAHEQFFLSDDLIRIIPDTTTIRPGYLFMAMGHPSFGRPLVIRNAYGSSIPHLDPVDVEAIPIVRLGGDIESKIADVVEESARLRDEANDLEKDLGRQAERHISKFISGPGAR
jgi:type I restriction enzyme, S subunit